MNDKNVNSKKPSRETAQRALEEAQERREKLDQQASAAQKAKELNGRKGPDPARYGDWENKGIASDF